MSHGILADGQNECCIKAGVFPDNEDDERQSGVVLDKGVKRKNSSTGEKNDRQVKRRHILSLEIDTDDVSFMHLSDKGSAQEVSCSCECRLSN